MSLSNLLFQITYSIKREEHKSIYTRKITSECESCIIKRKSLLKFLYILAVRFTELHICKYNEKLNSFEFVL